MIVKPKTQHTTIGHDGFALVATLTLMILLAVLAVGLLGLSAVSLRSASQGNDQAEARANARMALMMAMGELQAELGSDRRVNCQADIDSGALAGQRNWLAVYEAWNATDKDRPDAATKFRRYLVSGNRQALAVRDAAKTPLSGESISLVGEGTLGTGATDGVVRAGLMSLKKGNNSAGQYAWWIGDDNSKAMVNAGRDVPAAVSDELLAQHSAQSAPGTGYRLVDALAGVNGTGREDWEMGDDLRSKSVTLASLDLLPGAAAGIGARFHDITTSSSGLLADVRNGRLKRDLSLYLERPFDYHLRQPLYTFDGTVEVNFSPDTSGISLSSTTGITMEELWLYYNLPKEVDYNRPANNDDIVGRRPAGYPTLLSANSRDGVIIDRYFPYKRKIFAQVHYMLSLAAAPSATSTPEDEKFDLNLAIDPVVVLWNPYNVALEYQTGGYYTVGFSGLPYTAEFETPSGTTSVNFDKFFRHSDVNQILASIGRDHAIVLQPGESRVFSRADGKGNSLTSGWRYTDGILIDYKDFPKKLERSANVRLTLKPNDNQYLNYLTFWFGSRSTKPALQAGTYILRGDKAASTLPTVTTPQSLTVDNILQEKKIPHMLLSQHMRAETNAETPSKPWIWSNPSVIFRQAADGGVTSRLAHQMEIVVKQVDTWEDPSVQITPGNQSYWGGGTRADFGVPFFTLRGIPLTPIHSIAAFQHSCANGFRRHWKDSNVSTGGLGTFPQSAESLDGHRYAAPLGSKLIGNSFAHPLIPAAKTHDVVSATDNQVANPVPVPVPVADHAYLANAALWDSWYFSSLAPQTVEPYGSNKRDLQQVFDEFYPAAADGKPVPLPSVRMRPYRQGNEAALRALVSGGTPSDDAYRKLAAHLTVDGAFNVNSTSVTAWKVMLGSLRGHDTSRRDRTASSVTLEAASSGNTPVNGMTIASGPLATPSGDPQEPDQWVGFRSLDDTEIEKLATLLVDEISDRGPFLCLSDFINRRPGSDPELARHGALQAAIEKSGINGNLDKGTRAMGAIAGAAFPDAGKGSRAAGIPGYITQADLLTPLGPVLQARSDSFTIRAYGSATDSGGKVLARAWCEATVQRVPDYLDPADAPDVADAELSSLTNLTFGRQFRITSFRWLNSEEV